MSAYLSTGATMIIVLLELLSFVAMAAILWEYIHMRRKQDAFFHDIGAMPIQGNLASTLLIFFYILFTVLVTVVTTLIFIIQPHWL